MWCDACRSTGAIHCAMPDECGNMLSATAAADNWKAWLDDLPLPFTFDPAIGRLQDFITGLTARIEAQAGACADAQAAVALVVEQAVMDLPKAVGAAAIKWCGEKDRETFQSDIEYFRTNWRALPGLRDYVLRALALAPADGLAAVEALRVEIADLKMNMDADLRTMVREGQQLRTLAAELAAAQQREAELRGALEMSRQGWRNALELDLLPKQHRHSAKTMADIADAALASVDGLAMVQELQAERDSYRAALAPTPTDPGDGWTWNERLGWIGPDGRPVGRMGV